MSSVDCGVVGASPAQGLDRAPTSLGVRVSWVLPFPGPFPDHQPVLPLPSCIIVGENLRVSASFIFFKLILVST